MRQSPDQHEDPVNNSTRYRHQKVYCDQVYSEKFLRLRRPAQHAYFMLLAHPAMTSLGAMRARVAALADEWRWPPRDVKAALRLLARGGHVEWNERAGFLAFPRWLERNGAWSSNAVKAWSTMLDTLPECEEKVLLHARALEHLEGLSQQVKRGVPPVVWAKLNASSTYEESSETGVRTGDEAGVRTKSKTERREQETEVREQGQREGGRSLPAPSADCAGVPTAEETDEVMKSLRHLNAWEQSNVPGICEAVRAGRATEKQLGQFRGALRKVRSGGEGGYSVIADPEERRRTHEHFLRRVKERGL